MGYVDVIEDGGVFAMVGVLCGRRQPDETMPYGRVGVTMTMEIRQALSATAEGKKGR